MKLYCATSNPGKLREFIDILPEVEPLPGLGEIAAPPETGSTFEENARQKAEYYSQFADGCVFADDSGLEVDALGGAPGIYSARYAGPGATDAANNALLQEKLAGRADRRARFVCAVALARKGQTVATFRGVVEGKILDAPHGTEGFGYDPLFYYAPFGCSFGEVPHERKREVSHRGQALRALRSWLQSQNKDICNRNKMLPLSD